MNKQELVERYPWLRIGDKDLEITEEMITWVDLVPVGWLDAFGDFLFEDLDKAIKRSYPNGVPDDFSITDMKEKWGRLCIYTTHDTLEIRDVLSIYEHISSYICISCGAPYPFAHMTYNGWVLPLCENCFIKQRASRKFENVSSAHEDYLQTVLKDSISVFSGPEKRIDVESTTPAGDPISVHVDILPTWKKITTRYTQRKLI